MSEGAELILTGFSNANIVMIQGDKVVGDIQAVTAKEISHKDTYYTAPHDTPPPIPKHIQGTLIISYLNKDLWDGSKAFDIAAIWSTRESFDSQKWTMNKALMIKGADIISEELYETPPIAASLAYIARTYIREIKDLEELKEIIESY